MTISQKVQKATRPIRVLQFGEGNFLRGFVDYMMDIANEKGLFDGGIVLVKPIAFGSLEQFPKQDYNYTVSLRGRVDGTPTVQERIVTSVEDAVDAYGEYDRFMAYAGLETLRFVVSNTTEAGIVFDPTDRYELTPPNSFPGKLTKFLHARWKHFHGDPEKGLIMLPVELINDNGIMLHRCVLQLIELWGLEANFKAWVEEACVFTSTLVDRIITGYPRDEAQELWEKWGYEDRLIVTGEPFALWVIESAKDISQELPLPQAGLPVIFTDNQKPYKQRKVRILNGAHTSFVLAGYRMGHDIVRECMEDDLVRTFMNDTIFQEVIPTLDLPVEDLKSFAGAVIDRFNNPFVKHALLAISLNSVSKWRARCMPSLLAYVQRKGELPCRLAFSLAALMDFYQGTEIRDGALIGHRNGEEYPIRDDAPVLSFFAAHSQDDPQGLTQAFLGNEDFFGQDLTQVPGLEDYVSRALADIRAQGMRQAMAARFPVKG